MSFLRRLLGGSLDDGSHASAPGDASAPAAATGSADRAAPSTSAADDEAARDRELLLAEAHRLDNDLIQRQLRYADHAWTPPPQGGDLRAEDGDARQA